MTYGAGDWVLSKPLGEGGMALVWAARERRTGEEGAVKLLHPSLATQASARSRFAHEVRALATLDHPCVVPVLDQGALTEAEAASLGLAEGTPWFAMPIFRGGALGEVPGWAAVLAVGERVLRGLAHAHAAGMVHRDVKPGNVLLPRPSAWAEARLGDFGLARAIGEHRAGVGGGTPLFMAPEQLDGDWRRVDTRADLYAFGQLVWSLCHGEPRQAGAGFGARFATPGAVVDLLERLLCPRASGRPASAAEVLEAWQALGPPSPRTRSPRPIPRLRRGQPGPTLLPAGAAPTFGTVMEGGGALVVARAEPSPPLEPIPAPPVHARPPPKDWRQPKPPTAPPGSTLLGVRRPPFVGREAERDALWAELRAVTGVGPGEKTGPRLLLIQGEHGLGSSRTARWLAERVAEAGAATVIERRSAEALPAALARWLRADGLTGEALFRWIAAIAHPEGIVRPEEVAALAERIAPADPPRVRFRDDADRLQPLLGLVERLRARGPVVLVVDDFEPGGEVSALIEAVRAAEIPILVVLTAKPTVPAPDGSRTLRLGPLPPASMRELLESGLGLSPTAAAGLAERVGGNPGIAVDTVRQAWRAGQVRAARAGLELPNDVRLASSGTTLALRSFDPGMRDALEIAAILGDPVDPVLWRTVLLRAGVREGGAVEAGLVQGLLVAHPRGPEAGWSFVPGLRDALQAEAVVAGRAARWHRAALAALESLRIYAPDRFAGHLLGAGEAEAAIPWLRRAANAEIDAGDRRLADARVGALVAALDAAGVPVVAAARADADWLRARVRRLLGDADGALRAADRGLAVARIVGAVAEEIRCASERAEALRMLGRPVEALATLDAVEAAAVASGDPTLIGVWEQRRGTVAYELQDAEAAIAAGRRAREAFRRANDPVSAATAENLVGCGHGVAGRYEEARRSFAAALAEQEAVGCRWGAADAANNLGYVLYILGDRVAAAAVLERSAALWQAVGSPLWVAPRLNLARLSLDREGWAEAEVDAEAAVRAVRRNGMSPALLAEGLATLYAARAGLGDPSSVEVRRELADVLAGLPVVDPVIHQLLEIGDRRRSTC